MTAGGDGMRTIYVWVNPNGDIIGSNEAMTEFVADAYRKGTKLIMDEFQTWVRDNLDVWDALTADLEGTMWSWAYELVRHRRDLVEALTGYALCRADLYRTDGRDDE